MERILVSTDFSKYSTYAFDVAISIAKRTQSKIVLIHVIHLPFYDSSGLDAFIKNESEKAVEFYVSIEVKLEALVKSASLEGVECSYIVEQGNVADKILEVSTQLNVDMICTGLYGGENSRSIYGGSITQKIVRKSQCPVITVKDSTRIFNPERIVFSSTFFAENEEVLPKVAEFARIFGAELHLLKVVTPNHFERSVYSKKIIEELASGANVADYKSAVVNDVSVEEGVFWYASEIGANCICLSTHSRTASSRLINRSIAEEVAGHSNIPVITYRISDKRKKGGGIFPS